LDNGQHLMMVSFVLRKCLGHVIIRSEPSNADKPVQHTINYESAMAHWKRKKKTLSNDGREIRNDDKLVAIVPAG